MFLPLMVVSLTLCPANSFSSSSFNRNGLSTTVTIEVAAAYRARHAVVFGCCDHCVMRILRALSIIGIPASVINPNDPEVTKLLTTKTLSTWLNLLFIGDMECEGMSLVLENLPYELFSPPYHWLVFSSPQTWREKHTEAFHKIRFDSDFIVCVYDSPSVLELKELYSMNQNQERVVVVGSRMVGGKGIHDFIPKWYKFSYHRRGNMKGGTIRAIVSRMSLSYKSTSVFKRTGFGPHDLNSRVFLYIRDLFNFSIEERIIDGISSDAEIFHALKKGTSDVAVIVMGMIPQRSHDIAYLHAISRLRATITFLQPQVSALQNVFILPFSQDVWIFLLILVLLVFLFLTLDAYIVLDNNLWTVSDFFLVTIAMVCQKGIAKFPQIYSTCIVIFFFSIVMALLYSAYAGQIVSLLSIQEPLIKSIKDLSDYKFKLGVDAYPYLKMYFTDSADLSVQQLGRDHLTVVFPNAAEFVRKPQNCYSTSDYQADILKSAFHDDELCKLIIFNVPQAEAPLAMAVASQSQYKEMLNWATVKLMEQGWYSRYKNETEERRTSQCSDVRHSVELLGLLFVFYVLIGGMVAAAVLLLLEIIIWKLAESKKMKNQHQIFFIN